MKATSTKKIAPVKTEVKDNEILLMQINAEQNLRKIIEDSEKRYNKMLMQSPFAFAVLKGKDMVVAMANDSIKQMWGKGNKIEGKPLIEILPEIKDQEFPALLHKVYTTGIPYMANESLAQVKRNGKLEDVYFNFVYQPYREIDDTISGVTIIAIEVTNEVIAKKKIKANEEQLQNILLQAPAAIAVFDGPEHRFIMANQAYQKQNNRTEKDFLGKSFREVFPELEGTGSFELFDSVYTTGETFTASEYAAMIDSDNNGIPKQRYFNFSLEALKNESKEIYGVMVMAYDITEQVESRKKIEESEKRYNRILMQSPFAFSIMKGKDMVITHANDLIKDFWGKGNDVEGKTLLEVLPELKDQPFPEMLDSVYTTGKPISANEILALLNRHGIIEEHYFNLTYQPSVEADGTISGVITIAHEVTEQVLVRKKIEESEAKYRSLFNSIDAGFCILEVLFNENEMPHDYRFLEANNAFEKQTGLIDAVGKTMKEMVHGLEQYWFDIYGRIAKTGKPERFENEAKALSSYYEVYAFPVGEAGENRIGVLFNDITERNQTEEKIRESEKQLAFDLADAKKLQTFSTQIIHEENIDLLYEQLVDAAIALMHSDMASIQLYHPEKKQLELLTFKGFHPEAAAHWQWISTDSKSVCCAAMSNGERSIVSDLEKDELTAKTGGMNYYQLSGIRAVQSTPLISRNGDLVGMISTHWRKPHKPSERKLQLFDVLARQAADLIERKKTEEKLMEAKIFAENATKSKQQFLSNMSHEIRTPLNSILGFANVLLKTELGEEQKEFLHAIKTSGNSLNLLINDILDLAKVDAGRMTFVEQPFEIHKSIKSILYSFDLKIKEKNLELIKEYDSKIPSILLGDSVRLNQIVLNLISNAVKFTHKGKIILIVKLLHEDEENVNIEISVSDTGIGIATDKINSIFNLFEQAELSTSNSYGGTGLGLAIVKQLIEEQGGSISLKSKLGEGSTFSFILPFRKTNIKSEEEIEIPTLNSKTKNMRVLVAEDVALNQLLIKIILNDFGFEHEIVSNGKLAIEKMQTNTYDIILMDLQMPEMNGYEATEYIRKTLKSQIPIIALTADVTTADVSKCKEFGMDDYISKPISEKLLYNKIVGLVKKKR